MSLLLDVSVLEAVFVVNYQALCVASYRIVQDKAIAEDIVQDIFLRLWENRSTLIIYTSLKCYLYSTTVTQSLEYVKRFHNAFSKESFYTEDGYVESDQSEQTMALNGVGRRVEEAVRSLPEVSRLVFILSRYHKLNFQEISSKLEIPIKIVEGQLTHAINHLRGILLH